MVNRYLEIYLGSPDGLKCLIQGNLSKLLQFYRDSLWYGLSEEVWNYLDSLNFGSELEPMDVTQARYIDKFIEYVFDFYGEHHEFPESLGNVWCTESGIEHIFSITGRHIFAGYGADFDAGNKSTKIRYLSNSELRDLIISGASDFLQLLTSARDYAKSKGCGLVYSID